MTLLSWSDLTATERRLCTAAADGQLLDLTTGRTDEDDPAQAQHWNPDRSIRDHYAELIAAAYAQLTAPIILIWDNLNVHCSAAMRRFCDAHSDWLTVVQLPPYAPELNATEGVWAHVKRDLGNLLAGTVDELAASAKRLLKRIQYRPELIDGFRAQTGLALDPQPP